MKNKIMENEINEKVLVFVNLIGKDVDDIYTYEFIFSDTPDVVWGVDWDVVPSSLCPDIAPEKSTYCEIRKLRTRIPLNVAQKQSCFSMQDCIDGIIAVCYEDIEGYDEFPEEGRLVFHFGDKYMDVENKLATRHQLFAE